MQAIEQAAKPSIIWTNAGNYAKRRGLLRWSCFLLNDAARLLLKRAARTPPGLYQGDVASWLFEAESWKVDKSKSFDKDHSSIENQAQTFNIYAPW